MTSTTATSTATATAMATSTTRTYESAIEHLNSLQSNASTLDAIRASGSRQPTHAIPEMTEYLERIGYTTEDLNNLNVIHITGTKGKGSTSAFCDSILRRAAPRWTVGLFTSPHLVAVRERIRINGAPISEDAFTKYFYDVWDRLEANDTASKFVVVPPTPRLSDIKLENEDDTLTPEFVEGLEKARWPGRCQAVPDPKHLGTTWFIDGAHTVESLDCCVQWFVSPGVALGSSSPCTRVLIFNCTSGRSGDAFLGGMLAKATAQLKLHNQADTDASHFFDHVVFCSNVTYADGGFKGDLNSRVVADEDLAQLKTQRALESAWVALNPEFPKSNVHVLPSIEHAVNVVRQVEAKSEEVAGLAQSAL
ncbi:hypothetical protein ONZ45_g1374 [Pleurotus djamor]|nr:hypothetical protein ONZ45_g1374 [Pleurotus djamor]